MSILSSAQAEALADAITYNLFPFHRGWSAGLRIHRSATVTALIDSGFLLMLEGPTIKTRFVKATRKGKSAWRAHKGGAR